MIHILKYLRILAIAVMCIVSLNSPAAGSPASVPDSPAAHVLSMWLDAFNSGDSERVGEFFKKYRPNDQPAGELQFRTQTGAFDLLAITKSEPLHIEFLVKGRVDGITALGHLDVRNVDSLEVTAYVVRALPPGVTTGEFAIDATERNHVIDATLSLLKNGYVFPDVAEGMASAVRSRQEHRDYDAIENGDAFADQLTQDLRQVSHDKHLRVGFSPVARSPVSGPLTPEAAAMARRRVERNNCAFDKVEHLENNIGYIKLDAFEDPSICESTGAAAMAFIAHVDALIIDLRDNGGGSPAMVAFMLSYLFAVPTHLTDFVDRTSGVTTQSWTLADVPGPRLDTIPVYVLTSARTFSGGEEFAYDLQTLKRATIIGETTGGGANTVQDHWIDDRFDIRLPSGRGINPITKTNWEGVGVQPDIAAPAADALEKAQSIARKRVRTN